MTEINKENIRHIARLSYLHLKEKEVELDTDDVKEVATKTVYSDYSNYCFEHGMKKRSAS